MCSSFARSTEYYDNVREWLLAVESNPRRLLPVTRSLWTRGELYVVFRRYAPRTGISPEEFSRGLRAAGYDAVNLAEPVMTMDGAKRLFAIRNRELLLGTPGVRHIAETYNNERLRERLDYRGFSA